MRNSSRDNIVIINSLKDYIDKGYSIALIGCRARGRPFDICEYNMLVYARGSSDNDKSNYASISNEYNGFIELQCSDTSIKVHMLSDTDNLVRKAVMVKDMIILHDPNMELSTLAKDLALNHNIMRYYIRERLINTLIYLSKAINSDNLLASLWLKVSACYYIDACIAINGTHIMPAHMLQQLRSLSNSKDLNAIVESLGIDTNRSLLSIMAQELIDMLRRNNINDYTVEKKVNYLYSMDMHADLYTYICYICKNIITSLNKQYIYNIHREFSKIMHLSNDVVNVKNLAYNLMDICKERLKAIRINKN